MSAPSDLPVSNFLLMHPQRSLSDVHPVSVEHMQQIDREAIETVGIPRLLLMDHAGLALARSADELIQLRSIKPTQRSPILVCCGMGYNGGDGLAAARHLLQWGYAVCLMLVGDFNKLREEPAIFARILKRLAVPFMSVKTRTLSKSNISFLKQPCLYLDALLGIGAKGGVRKPILDVITHMNQSGKLIISADIPSGLDANTGRPQGISIKAYCTVSFGQPKQGCYSTASRSYVGLLVVDSITIPHYLLMKKNQ